MKPEIIIRNIKHSRPNEHALKRTRNSLAQPIFAIKRL